MKFKQLVCLPFLLLLFLTACQNHDYSPKPRAYYRINYPEKKYQVFEGIAPYSFKYPVYSKIESYKGSDAGNYWYNLHFPQFNGFIHITYYDVNGKNEYNKLVEYARELAFKHTIKASAIDQRLINYPNHKVYGIYYAIEGNTASSVQFFLTDSAKHYFRGSLYFNERPQYDSIAPVINFIKKDIDTLISTFRWKN
ncbi:gliding motility lipoprotein GldD [Pedobacter psychrodurus]|jgi:gliding motility-associated lipoprotein GldD|uniref:gliding motility lipoprotein GldD n=1 Tax=Pedobacter psychrodurus TaxID=2530456 RepID=UPI0029300315|nr:gliding motility lipoprotein GldD [Pedobacter psychrodurus]